MVLEEESVSDPTTAEPSTSRLPPILRSSPMPTPPVTTKAPVVLDEELSPEFIFPVPSTSRLPPMLRFSKRPKPPLTISAPVILEVEEVLLVNSTIPVARTVPSISNCFCGILLLIPTRVILKTSSVSV